MCGADALHESDSGDDDAWKRVPNGTFLQRGHLSLVLLGGQGREPAIGDHAHAKGQIPCL